MLPSLDRVVVIEVVLVSMTTTTEGRMCSQQTRLGSMEELEVQSSLPNTENFSSEKYLNILCQYFAFQSGLHLELLKIEFFCVQSR